MIAFRIDRHSEKVNWLHGRKVLELRLVASVYCFTFIFALVVYRLPGTGTTASE